MSEDAPVGRMLADPTRCRVFAPDVAVHWYPRPTAAACYCGGVTRVIPPASAEWEAGQ